MIGLGVYQPNELATLTAQPIINRLMETIDEIKINIYIDYIQNFIVGYESEELNIYKCNYIPLINSLVMLVNGVCYSNNNAITFFEYDEETNSVIWKFTKENGGFDLEEGFRVTLIYNFDMEKNGIESTDEVV